MTARPAVLVVEDSALVQEALGVLLEVGGYAPEPATSVAEARAALAARRYDAVLLDLTLPDGDGLAALAGLGVDAPPAIALTGHDDAGTAARCRAAGCVAVLVKPVRAAALFAALRTSGAAPDARGA